MRRCWGCCRSGGGPVSRGNRRRQHCRAMGHVTAGGSRKRPAMQQGRSVGPSSTRSAHGGRGSGKGRFDAAAAVHAKEAEA